MENKNHFDAVGNILNRIGERVEGNLYCDITADNITMSRNIEKIHNIQLLVRDKKRVCEIGVNAGHSLLFMLDVNPDAEYVIFDLANHSYTKPCVEYIQSVYPNTKIRAFYGDAKQTIRHFILDNPTYINSFDFIHIDGGHDMEDVLSDYSMSKKLGNRDSVIVFDDYQYEHIANFLNRRVLISEIKPLFHSELNKTERHFIYKLLK